MTTTPPLLELADGFSVHSPSEREARHIYKEIYNDHCYNVPNLPPAPFIVDAGANIGLFTLYFKDKYPNSTILAFEPAPQTYHTLTRNLALHGIQQGKGGVETYHSGLGEREGIAKFTYYPNAPGNSTLFPDQKEGLKELVVSKFPEHGARVIDAWLGKEVEVEIRIQRLSYFLRKHGVIESIDLLKVDVEGAEFEVLAGLDEEHWGLVRNVVLEIAEIRNEGALERMRHLLEGKGFIVTTEASHPDWSKDIFVVRGVRA